METKRKNLKIEKLNITSTIFIVLIIIHALFLFMQRRYILASFYFIPLIIFFIKRKLSFLIGLIPSVYILFNPFPISKITYSSGALIKIIQAFIANDPTTLGIGLSKAFYPILIVVFGIYNFLRKDKK